MKRIFLTLLTAQLLFAGCSQSEGNSDVLDIAQAQTEQMIDGMGGQILIPRTVDSNHVKYINLEDWTSGFFAGSLWYLYHLTEDEQWKQKAEEFTQILEPLRNFSGHHDVGFMVFCSYGNGLRFAGKSDYEPIITDAAYALATRFIPEAGIIQSWDINERRIQQGMKCPVIIDNMMNLEILFEAAKMTGDATLYNVAVSHADKTLENHFRDDYSTFHLVDYDLENGGYWRRRTHQGYADDSAWARGQAWAIYGFTMSYRYTRDERYLERAQKIASYIMGHPSIPEDRIPYWDYDAPRTPDEQPRDASAAAITSSALFELAQATGEESYATYASEILRSLSSPDYLAPVGSNGNFLLLHSTGNKPSGSEIDVPLNYADYYFLEALSREKDYQAARTIPVSLI